MNLERPEVVRALIGVAALMLVVGLIGAFTVDSGGSTKVAASLKATTTTAEGSSTTVTTAPAAPTLTTRRSNAVATTTKPAGTPSTVAGRVPDPGPTKPPAPGTYSYNTTLSGSQPTVTTEKIEALPDQGGAARRKDTLTDPQGNTLTNDEAWAADSVKILASHIVSPYATVDCTWQPPILATQLPLAIGKTWSSDSTCTTTFQGAQLTIHRVDHAKVTGKALDKVGATSVPVWIIELTNTTTVRHPFFNQDGSETQTAHFSPPHGLVTYEKTTGTSQGQSYTAERTLQSLTPK